jgi:hypothetical protein
LQVSSQPLQSTSVRRTSRQVLRVSDGIRTRGRRDHNPRDGVSGDVCVALARGFSTLSRLLVPLILHHEMHRRSPRRKRRLDDRGLVARRRVVRVDLRRLGVSRRVCPLASSEPDEPGSEDHGPVVVDADYGRRDAHGLGGLQQRPTTPWRVPATGYNG